MSPRKISQFALTVGIWACLLGAIWTPQDSLKWIGTSLYLILVGKYFGLTFRKEKIVGMQIVRTGFQLTNFLPLRGKQ